MADIYKEENIDLVVSAAIGGILIAGGVGKHLNIKHIFSERIEGEMVFKRGFHIEPEQNIIIVEDIVDTGLSLNFLKHRMEEAMPKSLRFASFLYKPDVASQEIEIDWIGFLNFPLIKYY